ncbi:Chromate resistance protein ChrB [Mesorhizobium sp. ORM6]
MGDDDEISTEQRWLLLIHQLPSKPAYFRVKIWRRLQGIGAVAVKSTVYALPSNAETQEDFEWLLKEIVEGGGEAMVCEARLIDGLSDAQARALFDAARDGDYEEIAKDLRVLGANSKRRLRRKKGPRHTRRLAACAKGSPMSLPSISSVPIVACRWRA